jgi:hypothetical protein
MAIDFSVLVYLPNFDVWARSITVTPSGGGTSYQARGIFHTGPSTIMSEGVVVAVISDQQTTLDIRAREFAAIPRQGDLIDIPQEGQIEAEGLFKVTDAFNCDGGEWTLVMQRVVLTAP